MKKILYLSIIALAGVLTGCKKDSDPVAVSGLTLNKTTLALAIGNSETLTATVLPDNAENKTVTWASSATAVATVDAAGKVTAVAKGTTTITATAGGKTAACEVTVNFPVIASGTAGLLAWVLTGDGTLTISGAGAIPEYNYLVGIGGSDAPWYAHHEAIKNLTIGQGVTSIGVRAFSDCSNLTGLSIPNSVTSIGNYAFYGCSKLTSLSIPNSATSIGDGAFRICIGLTVVTIPNSVTSIGSTTFSGCTGLTSIDVATGNPNYASENGVLFNKAKSVLICYPGGKQGAYTIANSVTSIGDFAFYYCTSLTSVTIPSSVTSIGGSAFWSCSGLISVTIMAGTPPTLGSLNFTDTGDTLHVPAGSLDDYKNSPAWSAAFTTIVVQ